MPDSRLKDTTVGAIIVGVLTAVLSGILLTQVTKRLDTSAEHKTKTSEVEDTRSKAAATGQVAEQPKRKCIAVGMAFDERMTAEIDARTLSQMPLHLVKALQGEGICASVVPTAMAVEGFHLASKPVAGDEGKPLSSFAYALLISVKEKASAPQPAVGEQQGIQTNADVRKEMIELEISCYRLPSAELIDIVRDSFAPERTAAPGGGITVGEEPNLAPESFEKAVKRILPLISQ
jgi:hypothetical protein